MLRRAALGLRHEGVGNERDDNQSPHHEHAAPPDRNGGAIGGREPNMKPWPHRRSPVPGWRVALIAPHAPWDERAGATVWVLIENNFEHHAGSDQSDAPADPPGLM